MEVSAIDIETDIEQAPQFDRENAAAHAAASVTRAEAVVINPVPYSGDEETIVHEYQPFIDGGFWINKPA